ncbi:MAG: molybdopterin-dependent oxidoreductase [Marinosulfonomonas sp.]|nr:molybdopterin-dependent oxidoreductase [Marinosulfonomonas sp.]
MNTVCTTCPYCGVGCGLQVNPDGKIKADPDHPANFGRLCSKGSALGETTDLDGRLLVPRVRGARARWNDALDLVADKFSTAIRDHGPDSVAFYVSGQLLSEDYYIANKLMKGFIGSANIDTNSRLCMASSVAGHKRAFGTDTVPGDYTDLEQADVIVLTGSNLAWCHPVLFQRILAAKSKRPDLKLITIDPRRTASAAASDLHLAIRADGDTALFNGLLCEINRRGAVDRDYVDAHVNGFDAALAAAQVFGEGGTGLSDDDRRSFHDLWIGAQKVVTIYSQGVNQSVGGTDTVNAIINCHLAAGRIGRAGMGPFSVTGQPNAMGGREVGGLANMLACHLDIENETHRDVVQQAWDSPTICTQAGLKAVDMFRACESGQIKALWIMATNPAVSLPEADAVSLAIKNVDFSVISEVESRTDTSVLTGVQLPATAWGEKTGTVTNSERCISMQRAFLPAPGEARPDWKIICDVAQRMGWEAAFDYNSPADIFREYAALSGKAAALGRDFDISGLANISDEEYADFQPVQWPVTAENPNGGRFFGQGGFFHDDQKAKMLPITPTPFAAPQNAEFILNTGRIRDQWHTMTRTGKSARLSQHKIEPFAEIHPDDAGNLGVNEGELITLKRENVCSVVRVDITDSTPRGSVFVPMHWTHENAPTGRVNTLVKALVDPVSGQPASKCSRVKLGKCQVKWYGFAASAAQMQPTTFYSAIARTNTGWRAELAGKNAPEDWEQEARRVLNLDIGTASVMSDPSRGVVRISIHDKQVLRGVLFAAPDPITIARDLAVARINSNEAALTVLAGVPTASQEDTGATVCACFNVGGNTLRRAISDGAMNVGALGKCTNAGTNCGSCKAELQGLIDETKNQIAAE